MTSNVWTFLIYFFPTFPITRKYLNEVVVSLVEMLITLVRVKVHLNPLTPALYLTTMVFPFSSMQLYWPILSLFPEDSSLKATPSSWAQAAPNLPSPMLNLCSCRILARLGSPLNWGAAWLEQARARLCKILPIINYQPDRMDRWMDRYQNYLFMTLTHS